MQLAGDPLALLFLRLQHREVVATGIGGFAFRIFIVEMAEDEQILGARQAFAMDDHADVLPGEREAECLAEGRAVLAEGGDMLAHAAGIWRWCGETCLDGVIALACHEMQVEADGTEIGLAGAIDGHDAGIAIYHHDLDRNAVDQPLQVCAGRRLGLAWWNQVDRGGTCGTATFVTEKLRIIGCPRLM